MNEEKIIRFKTSPRIAHKKHSIFPESKYYNKLHNLLRIFTKLKNMSKSINDVRLLDDRNLKIIKDDINDVFIKTQCKLHQLPIKLYGNKFIETDYLEPYWDEYSIEKSPKYVLISKQYVLLEVNEAYNIIELKNWNLHKEGKRVKIHKVILPQGYKIIYE